MKINEVTQAKISKVMPGKSAEIDHGDGTKTVVDLKKNPDALNKDAGTGRVSINQPNQQNRNQANSNTKIRPGDRVEIDREN